MMDGNRLFCGDNLQVLRDHVADESVDLCYIDPPFHSRRDYRAREQPLAFTDTWTWDEPAESGFAAILGQPCKVARLLEGLEPVIGRGSLLAYLVSVTQRLVEIERALRPTGSLFLHCDSHRQPLSGSYCSTRCSARRAAAFANEIVCVVIATAERSRKWFGRKHDIISLWQPSDRSYFDATSGAHRYAQRIAKPSDGSPALTDEDGRKYRLVYGTRNSHGVTRYYKYYLDEGKLPEDWWTDINSLQASAARANTGYPTQKPEAAA